MKKSVWCYKSGVKHTILFLTAVLLTTGCGSKSGDNIEILSKNKSQATLTVQISKYDNNTLVNKISKPMPTDVASIIVNIYDATGSTPVVTKTINNSLGIYAVETFNLNGDITYDITASAFSGIDGTGTELFNGTVSGIFLAWGGSTSVNLYLAILGAASPSAIVSAENIAHDSVTLTADINPNGYETATYFEWGTDTNYGSSTPTRQVGEGTTSVVVTQSITGLVPGTLYYYRTAAINSGGTLFANDSFTTLGLGDVAVNILFYNIPNLIDVVVGINGATASLSAGVNPQGTQTSAYFEWGTTAGGYDSTTFIQDMGSSVASQTISASLATLAAETYQVRIVAFNAEGLSVGNDIQFTIP